MPAIQFVVDRKGGGQTLVAVLKMQLGLSWSQAKRLVEGRHVRVGQQVVDDVARRVKTGKRIQITAGAVEVKQAIKKPKPEPKPAPVAKAPRSRDAKPATRTETAPDLDIVFSDDAIVVVNKPVGLTTMRSTEEVAEFGEHGQKFLTRTLAGMLPGVLGTPDRPVHAVHRIDRDTSGLVVFARTRAAADKLTEQFRKHTVDRRYVALTRGLPKSGKVSSVFVADRGDGRRGSSRDLVPEDGKRAVTHVKVLEQLGDFAAVECRLETGRTHQVRIHLGEAGTPLCGEKLYDRPTDGRPLPDGSGAARPMLHAARLGFAHPQTGEAVTW
ncbi:MAG TPA: RluA family pseudouridine synthase, partial [Gemmataceae bacterium]|nr:RluA family pseudouridine synthase [Gemmataceae bacterium]